MNQNIQTVRILGQEIRTTVRDQPRDVDKWIKKIISMGLARTIGLSCQRNPYSSPEGGIHSPNKVATLQMFAFDRCIIVQLFHMAQVPDSLKAFLVHPNIHFVVVGEDAEKLLREQYGLEIATPIKLEKITLAYEVLNLGPDPLPGGVQAIGSQALRVSDAETISCAGGGLGGERADGFADSICLLDTYVAYMLCRKLKDNFCPRCLFKLCNLLEFLAI